MNWSWRWSPTSIPLASFEVSDMAAEYARLKALGAVFTAEPINAGPVVMATFSNTCGNLVMLYQPAQATRL